MKTTVKINATNSNNEELASIVVTIQVNVTKCSDVQGVIKGLLQKMLSCDSIMKTFNLRSCDLQYIAENTTNVKSGEFEISVPVAKNAPLNRRAIIGPRPCEMVLDTSVNLHVLVQHEGTTN